MNYRSSDPALNSSSRSNQGERWSWVILLFLAVLASYKAGQRSVTGVAPRVIDQMTASQQRVMFSDESREEASSSSAPASSPAQEASEDDESVLSASITQSVGPQPALECPALECPPCDCSPPPPPKPKAGRRPPPAKPISPVDRQRLLAWVKHHSPRLKRCRDAGQPIYRLNARVQLNAKLDRILKVQVKGSDVATRALRCVEADIKSWPSPEGLSEDHPPLLIFGLQLD